MVKSKIAKISDCIRYLNVLISYFFKQFDDSRAAFCLIDLSTVINLSEKKLHFIT